MRGSGVAWVVRGLGALLMGAGPDRRLGLGVAGPSLGRAAVLAVAWWGALGYFAAMTALWAVTLARTSWGVPLVGTVVTILLSRPGATHLGFGMGGAPGVGR